MQRNNIAHAIKFQPLDHEIVQIQQPRCIQKDDINACRGSKSNCLSGKYVPNGHQTHKFPLNSQPIHPFLWSLSYQIPLHHNSIYCWQYPPLIQPPKPLVSFNKLNLLTYKLKPPTWFLHKRKRV